MKRAAALLALPLLVGCERPPGADGRSAAAPADTVRATPGVTIGGLEGDPEDLFGDVTSVAADAAGRIYVADRIGSTVRVFGPDGRFLAWIGREGEGPGEFQWPADLAFDREGRLYVRDARRITVLAPRGPGAVPDSVTATWRLSDYGNLSSTRSRVDSAGRYLYPRYVATRAGLRGHLYEVYADGEIVDTLPVPAYPNLSRTGRAFYRLGPTDGRLVHGLSAAPFAPVPSWDVTPRATVVGGEGSGYLLVETDLAGDTVRTIRGPDPRPRPVPREERADSARALQARLDSLPVGLDRVENLDEAIREGRLPEVLPAFLSVHVGTYGHLWVERWPPEGRGEERFYDLFDPSGVFCGTVALPAPVVRDPPPYFGEDSIYGVVRDPDTEVDRVVRLDLEVVASEIGRCASGGGPHEGGEP